MDIRLKEKINKHIFILLQTYKENVEKGINNFDFDKLIITESRYRYSIRYSDRFKHCTLTVNDIKAKHQFYGRFHIKLHTDSNEIEWIAHTKEDWDIAESWAIYFKENQSVKKVFYEFLSDVKKTKKISFKTNPDEHWFWKENKENPRANYEGENLLDKYCILIYKETQIELENSRVKLTKGYSFTFREVCDLPIEICLKKGNSTLLIFYIGTHCEEVKENNICYHCWHESMLRPFHNFVNSFKTKKDFKKLWEEFYKAFSSWMCEQKIKTYKFPEDMTKKENRVDYKWII